MGPHVTDPRFGSIEQFSLERLKFALQQVVPAEMLRHTNIRFVEDDLTHGIIVGLRTEILGERLGPQKAHGQTTVEFTMPDGWWQHWKEDHRTRWYARWIIRRWPIRIRMVSRHGRVEVDIERFRVFPHSTIRYPDSIGRQVQLLQPQTMSWMWADEAEETDGR